MKKNRIIGILSIWIGMVISCYGQTAYWIVEPSTYNEIKYIAPNIYKVTKNGKIGLINAAGEVIADPVNDEMTGFYENKALLLKSDGNGDRIIGCVTGKGIYYKFANAFYTLNGQVFFSDGVITVGDENKKLGYVDEKGNPVLGFDGKYDKIKPFTEGYASVFSKKKYSLIDKDGQPVRLAFDGVGEVYGGTNVYKGTAYVWDTNGKFYTYNVEKGGFCKKTKTPENTSSVDYLYRFSCISGLGKQPTYTAQEAPKIFDPGFPSVVAGPKGKGYAIEGKTVIKEQFSEAGPFLTGAAIVKNDGRCGMLGYTKDDGFSAFSTSQTIRTRRNQAAKCNFTIQVPKAWRNKDINVSITDSEGSPLQSTFTNNTLVLDVVPTTDETITYHIYISGSGLSLWDGTVSQKYEIIPVCRVCDKELSQCEFRGNHPVNNPGLDKKKNENIETKKSFEY